MKELAGVSAYGLRVMFLYGQNVIDQALSPSYQIFSFSLLGLYEIRREMGRVGLLQCLSKYRACLREPSLLCKRDTQIGHPETTCGDILHTRCHFDCLSREHLSPVHVPASDIEDGQIATREDRQRQVSNFLSVLQAAEQHNLGLVVLSSSQVHISQIAANDGNLPPALILFKQP